MLYNKKFDLKSLAVQSKLPEYDAENIRELIEKPYRIIYRAKQNQIDVLAIIDGAQLLPDKI